MINTKKPSQLCKFDRCDFVNIESSVRYDMIKTQKLFQCDYSNLQNMFSDILKMHIPKNIFPVQISS